MINNSFEQIMKEIILVQEAAGNGPCEQIYDYIQTGKPQYITRFNKQYYRHNCQHSLKAFLNNKSTGHR